MVFLYYCTGEVVTASGTSIVTLKVNAIDRASAVRQVRSELRSDYRTHIGRITAVRIGVDAAIGTGGGR
jgi:hypothetical protein